MNVEWRLSFEGAVEGMPITAVILKQMKSMVLCEEEEHREILSRNAHGGGLKGCGRKVCGMRKENGGNGGSV